MCNLVRLCSPSILEELYVECGSLVKMCNPSSLDVWVGAHTVVNIRNPHPPTQAAFGEPLPVGPHSGMTW